MTALEILQPGPLALIQDRGRPGLAHLGVTRSGAADRAAHALANRLVANPHDRATIEVTMGGLVARARDGDTVIAVTGADPRARIGSIPFGLNSVVHLRAGEVVHLDVPRTGMRSYLAVRGGVEVPPVLGSRSYDVLSGIGPAPLRAGDIVVIGEHGPQYPEVDLAPVAPLTDQLVAAAMMRGPRDDWISDVDGLVRDAWTVSDRSDRIGMRLHGRPLTHREPGRQLPSEGAVRGAIQVPPNGLPVILGPDHPVTGGYPVIGVVVDGDLDALAQVRAGQPLRLRWAHS